MKGRVSACWPEAPLQLWCAVTLLLCSGLLQPCTKRPQAAVVLSTNNIDSRSRQRACSSTSSGMCDAPVRWSRRRLRRRASRRFALRPSVSGALNAPFTPRAAPCAPRRSVRPGRPPCQGPRAYSSSASGSCARHRGGTSAAPLLSRCRAARSRSCACVLYPGREQHKNFQKVYVLKAHNTCGSVQCVLEYHGSTILRMPHPLQQETRSSKRTTSPCNAGSSFLRLHDDFCAITLCTTVSTARAHHWRTMRIVAPNCSGAAPWQRRRITAQDGSRAAPHVVHAVGGQLRQHVARPADVKRLVPCAVAQPLQHNHGSA